MAAPQFERDGWDAYADWLAGIARVPGLFVLWLAKAHHEGYDFDPDEARELLLDPRLAGLLRHYASADSN